MGEYIRPRTSEGIIMQEVRRLATSGNGNDRSYGSDRDRPVRQAEREEDRRIMEYQECGGGRHILRKKIGGE